MKKIVYFLLFVLWLLLIFHFSHQTGEVSDTGSIGIIQKGLETIYHIFHLPKENIEEILIFIHNPIRECMHALEYFVLGFLTFQNIKNFNIKGNPYIITVMFCFICATFDEIHQLFIEGRAFEYLDIGMDMLGVISILLLIYHFQKNKE